MIQEFEKKWHKKDFTSLVADLHPGSTLRVHQKIKEGDKERVQIFEGIMLKMNSGYGVGKTFTVRKIVDGVGVEKIFPVNSPNIQKIEVTKRSRVRRAKLYYMRGKEGKSVKLYEEKKEEPKSSK